MMNSFEHAMVHQDEGQITIRFEETEGDLVLSVEDNGPGFAAELEELTSDSLGLKLVQALAIDQLGGTVSADGSDGAHFEVRLLREQPASSGADGRETR
jgi:two-component sensor histidine kinase